MHRIILFATLALSYFFFLTTPAHAIETGPDDFRITQIGPDGDTAFFASRPILAYNSTDDEFMTVFVSAGGPGLADGEIELWSQRVGTDGSILGSPIRVTEVGGLDQINAAASSYQMVYNSAENEYLLVWQTQDPVFNDDRPNIYARRISNLGSPLTATFAVSQTTSAGAFWPQLAYNATDNEYIVVWTDNDSGTFLITAQIMDKDTTVVRDDFIVSVQSTFFSDRPAVSWDSVNNQYLALWTNSVALFGNILDADGDFLVSPDFRITANSQGTQGAGIAFDPDSEEYLVAFGNSVSGISSAESSEVYTRRVSSAGVPQGSEVRISFSSGDGEDGTGANIDMSGETNIGASPSVAYNVFAKSFVVSWDSLVMRNSANQREAFVRTIRGGADPDSSSAVYRISDMGGPTDAGAFAATHPVISTRDSTRYLLTVWWGDDNRSGGVDNEIELYGQLLDMDLLRDDGFEE